MSKPSKSQQRYDEIVAALLKAPDVSQSAKKGFGQSGLMVRGKLFAILRADELLLKLPAARVKELIASGDGKPFDAGRGRPMKEWATIKPSAKTDWLALAREAMMFVGDDG